MLKENDFIQVGFDEFLNRHRDPKDIEKEVLEKKLANTDPFKGDRYLFIAANCEA